MLHAQRLGKRLMIYLGLISLGYASGRLVLSSGLLGGILLATVSCALAMVETSVAHFNFLLTHRGRTSWLVSFSPVVVMMVTFLWGVKEHDALATQAAFVIGLCFVPAIIARFVTLTVVDRVMRDGLS
mgnify:CR=1 FL=1